MQHSKRMQKLIDEAEASKWEYLEKEPADDAPISDNPSGMYCPSCRGSGLSHCAHPEWCGGMRLMKPKPITTQEKNDG